MDGNFKVEEVNIKKKKKEFCPGNSPCLLER